MFEIVNLTKTYNNEDGQFIALNNLNFKLGNKGIIFLYGNSGEGKSTLLNVLSGLDKYDSTGQILYNHKDIASMSQKDRDIYRSREVALLFENDNLVDNLSVAENIAIAKQICGYHVSSEEIEKVLRQVKLNGFENRKVYELSSGEKQRIAIARILLLKPKVLFMDEPTGHLDKENTRLFYDLIKKQSEDCLVVAISHKKEIVDEYADRIIELRNGEIYSDKYTNKTLKKEDLKVFETPLIKYNKVNDSIRPNIPLKVAFRFGLQVLNTNKFKFISMLVLTCLCLMMFSMSYMLTNYSNSMVLSRSAGILDVDYVTYEKEDLSTITNNDLTNLYTNGYNSNYFKVYDVDMSIDFYDINEKNFEINSIMEINNSENLSTNALGQNILCGNYPSSTDPYNAIVISDYLATKMSKHGVFLFNEFGSHLFKDGKFENLLNKKILIDNNYYIIYGVYETNYMDYCDENLEVLKNKEVDFEYNLNNIYSIIHTGIGAIENFVGNYNYLSDVNFIFTNLNTNKSILRTFDVQSLSNVSNDASYNFLGNKTTLSPYEILLPINLFNEIYKADISFGNYTNDDIVSEYIGNNQLIKISCNDNDVEYYNVLGVTNNDAIIFADNGDDFAGCIGEIVGTNSFKCSKVASLFKDDVELKKTIEIFSDAGFNYISQYSDSINEISEFINLLKVVFIVVTIFCAMFSMYFMYTFFGSVIRHRKKSIGILRAMGANTNNIIGIFMVSCLMLTIMSLFGSVLLSWLGGYILNSLIMNAFAVPMTILNFTFGMFGLMFVLGLFVTIIGSIVPINIYCKKAPITILKR